MSVLPVDLTGFCTRDRLDEKNGRNDGFGVEDIDIPSISGSVSLIPSNSSNNASKSSSSLAKKTWT